MAKITDFLNDLKRGAYIRRKIWYPNYYIHYNNSMFYSFGTLHKKYFFKFRRFKCR